MIRVLVTPRWLLKMEELTHFPVLECSTTFLIALVIIGLEPLTTTSAPVATPPCTNKSMWVVKILAVGVI